MTYKLTNEPKVSGDLKITLKPLYILAKKMGQMH